MPSVRGATENCSDTVCTDTYCRRHAIAYVSPNRCSAQMHDHSMCIYTVSRRYASICAVCKRSRYGICTRASGSEMKQKFNAIQNKGQTIFDLPFVAHVAGNGSFAGMGQLMFCQRRIYRKCSTTKFTCVWLFARMRFQVILKRSCNYFFFVGELFSTQVRVHNCSIPLVANFAGQSLHVNRFSPVCISKCWLKLPLLLNALPHSEHRYGVSPVCTRM